MYTINRIMMRLKLLHVPTFRDDADVWRFADAAWRDPLIGEFGIYKHRWGDGALRYQQVHLFPQLYEHTHYLCDVHYLHRFRHVATCAPPPSTSASASTRNGRDEEVDADAERDVHTEWPPRPGALRPRLREYAALCAEATDLPDCMHTVPHDFERLSLNGQFV